MFEPVHGSAPDIAGKGIVNPLAAILGGNDARALQTCGRSVAGFGAVAAALEEAKTMPADLGGSASTGEITDAVITKL